MIEEDITIAARIICEANDLCEKHSEMVLSGVVVKRPSEDLVSKAKRVLETGDHDPDTETIVREFKEALQNPK